MCSPLPSAIVLGNGATHWGSPEDERRQSVFARVATFQAPPDRVEEGIRYVYERLLPQTRQMEGFKEAYILVDRQSGKGLIVGLWESEQALRASEETAARQRGESKEALGMDVVRCVEEYEVVAAPEGG
jgi:heme-degrading monooxygenase HmoA